MATYRTLNKKIMYWRELREHLAKEICMAEFDEKMVKRAIEAGKLYMKTQTVIKRTPKTRDIDIWALSCAIWIDCVLKTNRHSHFSSFFKLEDWLRSNITMTGVRNHIVECDAEWTKLWKQYKPLIWEWYYSNREEDRKAAATKQALQLLEKLDEDTKNALRDLLHPSA